MEGKGYSRPNDEQEMNRLLLLHDIMTRLIGGLYMAPVDKAKTKRILDIGTGTGVCKSSVWCYYGWAAC